MKTPLKQSQSEQAFSSRLEIDPDTECWEWQAHYSNGKPRFYVTELGGQAYAVRWAYEHWVGPIPRSGRLVSKKGICAMGRRCVNPWHFTLVTRIPQSLPLQQGMVGVGTAIHQAVEATDSEVQEALDALETDPKGS